MMRCFSIQQMQPKTLVCKWCLLEKPLEQFAINTSYKAGYENTCKRCKAKQRRERRRIKPDPPRNGTPIRRGKELQTVFYLFCSNPIGVQSNAENQRGFSKVPTVFNGLRYVHSMDGPLQNLRERMRSYIRTDDSGEHSESTRGKSVTGA